MNCLRCGRKIEVGKPCAHCGFDLAKAEGFFALTSLDIAALSAEAEMAAAVERDRQRKEYEDMVERDRQRIEAETAAALDEQRRKAEAKAAEEKRKAEEAATKEAFDLFFRTQSPENKTEQAEPPLTSKPNPH
jgi:hypothetical protein